MLNSSSGALNEDDIFGKTAGNIDQASPSAMTDPASEPPSAQSTPRKSKQSSGRTMELYESARKSEERLTALRQQQSGEFSFAPTLASKPTGKDRPVEELTQSLYKDGEMNEKKKEQARVAAEAALGTFKPQFLTTNSPFKDKKESGGTPRHDLLFESAKDREKTVKEIEAQVYGGLSFSPSTEKTRLANERILASSQNLSRTTGTVVERLYEEGVKKTETDNARVAKKEESELEGCTFQPKVSNYKGGKDSSKEGDAAATATSVHERLYTDASRTKESITKLKEQAQEDSLKPCTFQPQVSSKAKVQGSAVHDRLYQSATISHSRKVQEAKTPIEKLDKECTFAPAMSPKTLKLAAERQARNESSVSGQQRIDEMYQAGYMEQKRRAATPRDDVAALKLRMEEEELEKYCTFHPDTGSTKDSPFRVADREKGALFDELYEKRSGQEKAREKATAEANGECTFKPKLVSSPRHQSSGSSSLTRTTGAGGATSPTAKGKKATAAAAAGEEQEGGSGGGGGGEDVEATEPSAEEVTPPVPPEED